MYFLLPGDYGYLAAEEGYNPVEGSFTVPAEVEELQIEVTLNASSTEQEPKQLDEGIVDSGSCGENLTWKLSEDGVLFISGTGDMEDYSVDVPAPWYQYSEQITAVSIEPGITTIGTYAFYHCNSLNVVNIPEGVTRIKPNTFLFCGRLFVYFPRSVTIIDKQIGFTTTIYPYYGGSEAEWENVQIGENNGPLGIGRYYNVAPDYYNEYFVRLNATHACNLTEVPAQAPTDSQDGSFAYWICSNCHQTYRDRNGVSKTTGVVPEVIPAGSISWQIVDNAGHPSIIVSKDGVMDVSGNGWMSDQNFRYPGFGNREKINTVRVGQGILEIDAIAGFPNLTSIIIPTSVTRIDTAFYQCDKLSDIYYDGTAEDWSRIMLDIKIFNIGGCTL